MRRVPAGSNVSRTTPKRRPRGENEQNRATARTLRGAFAHVGVRIEVGQMADPADVLAVRLHERLVVHVDVERRC